MHFLHSLLWSLWPVLGQDQVGRPVLSRCSMSRSLLDDWSITSWLPRPELTELSHGSHGVCPRPTCQGAHYQEESKSMLRNDWNERNETGQWPSLRQSEYLLSFAVSLLQLQEPLRWLAHLVQRPDLTTVRCFLQFCSSFLDQVGVKQISPRTMCADLLCWPPVFSGRFNRL